uniref:Insertion element IS53 DNA sequence n=1 Tax=Pseudomonas syringae TaxID=317 RepID=Q52513_PSESX|nr:ORF1 [Pseudomonas savastanoi]
MEMLGKIRRMYFRDKLSLHQIAKRTGLSRNTIRKWVRAPEANQPAYQRCASFNKLNPFHETLEQALKADSFRPKHNRRSAKALFEQIKAEGYDGGYSQLTAFVPLLACEQGKSVRRFCTDDFASVRPFSLTGAVRRLLYGGLFRRIQVSHMKLCASRAFWLVAYPSQGHEMLFDAHTRSFGALGGVPRRGIYDNMKTAVDWSHRQRPHGQCPVFRDVRALSVRSGLLQRGLWLGERHRRKERARQPEQSGSMLKLHVPYLRGAERLARPTLSYALG